MMRKNKTMNYNCYKGVLHTYGESGSSIFHKRIYYRLIYDEDGNQKAKEILTGTEFPTAYGIILGEYSNVDNFVSGNTEVYDYEVDKYLNSILSDKRIFDIEIQEILFPKSIVMNNRKNKKRIKM